MEANYLSDFKINLHDVKKHYTVRESISEQLKSFLKNSEAEKYVELALGVSDPLGNYSAYEHAIGPKILANNSVSSVFRLAQELANSELKVTHVPKTIYQANLPYLKIGIGSEIACLLQPNRFWVCNVRTIWPHLVIRHEGDWDRANEELELYRINDTSSEMHYKIWRDIYLSMEASLNYIGKIAEEWAEEQNIKPGKLKYIWVDAICNALYERK